MLLARKEIFGGILFDSIKKQFSVLNILAFEQIVELLNSNKATEIPLLLQQLGLSIPAKSSFNLLPELAPVKGALSSPSVVFFVVTNKCNLRCKHCFVSNSVLSSPNSDLSLQDIQKIILDLKKNNVFKLIITGGEPFLRKDIIDILSFVSKQGLEMQVNTNGLLLTDAILSELKNKNISIIHFTFSLEGTQQSHDLIRGSGNYDKVIEAIKRTQSYGYEVMVNITSKASVLGELNDITASVMNLGVRKINFSMLRPSGAALKLLDQYYDYNLHDFKQFVDNVNAMQRKHGLESHIETLESPMLFEFVDGYCGGATISLAILPDGKASPCTYVNEVLETQSIPLDNILENGLFNIWRESPAVLWLRNYQNSCVECEYVKSCGQQCPIEAFVRGDLYGKSLYCKQDDWNIKLKHKLNQSCI